MFFTRIIKRAVAALTLTALVFMGLAVSAYACPMLTPSVGEPAMAMACAGEPDANAPGLCQKHCESGQQNASDPASPLASVALEPAFVVTVPAVQASAPADIILFPSLLHATAPPHSVRNCCFRI